MTTTAAPVRAYGKPVRLPPRTRFHQHEDGIEYAPMPRSFYKPVVTMNADGNTQSISVDTDGRLWVVVARSSDLRQQPVDWHRLEEYIEHGYNVRHREWFDNMTHPSMLLEPLSKDKVLDFIADTCTEEGVKRLGAAAQPRYGRPVSKDWSVSKLLTHFDEQEVTIEMRGDRLLLTWPDGKGPHTLDLRHALDVLGGLLKAKVSGRPVACHAVDGCSATADTLLFLDTPACARHAEAAYEPKVEADPVPWWEVTHGQRPRFRFTPEGVRVMGLAMPPDDARIRLYWKD